MFTFCPLRKKCMVRIYWLWNDNCTNSRTSMILWAKVAKKLQETIRKSEKCHTPVTEQADDIRDARQLTQQSSCFVGIHIQIQIGSGSTNISQKGQSPKKKRREQHFQRKHCYPRHTNSHTIDIPTIAAVFPFILSNQLLRAF